MLGRFVLLFVQHSSEGESFILTQHSIFSITESFKSFNQDDISSGRKEMLSVLAFFFPFSFLLP